MSSSTLAVPLVKQLLDIYGVRAQKEFSQNFLLNNAILGRIAGLIPRVDARTLVVEIGSGPASLTRALLERRPGKVIGLEVDRRFEPILSQLAEANHTVFSPVFRNALEIEDVLLEHLQNAPQYGSVSIVGNLPFALASLILQRLLHLFDHTRTDISASPLDVSLILMFQLEVAQVYLRTIIIQLIHSFCRKSLRRLARSIEVASPYLRRVNFMWTCQWCSTERILSPHPRCKQESSASSGNLKVSILPISP